MEEQPVSLAVASNESPAEALARELQERAVPLLRQISGRVASSEPGPQEAAQVRVLAAGAADNLERVLKQLSDSA
ncbi:MAG: hypothetical protein M3072_17485 [Candidatus Dormibacteraeota bacterium]|nr:hypothetical protein [Candidatus Dormibacteraeota bacterium]